MEQLGHITDSRLRDYTQRGIENFLVLGIRKRLDQAIGLPIGARMLRRLTASRSDVGLYCESQRFLPGLALLPQESRFAP